MRYVKILIMLSMILLLLISCERKVARVPADGIEGGDIVVGMISQPENLSPMYPSFTSHNEIADMLFLPLHKQDYQDNIVPMLATSWEYSEDLTKITYYLRKDVLWQDSQPVTAYDVEFTFNAMKNPENGYPLLSRLQYIDSVKAVDENTIVFYFAKVYPMALFDSNIRALPKHLLEKEENIRYADFHMKPVGNGPYKLDKWEDNKYIALEKNEQYSLDDKPFINKIVYRIFPSQEELISAVKEGSVDVVYDISPEMNKEVEKLKNVKVINKQGNTYVYMGFNMERKPFDQKEVRIGISHMIDREGLIKNYVGNNAIVSNGPLTPSFWAYSENIKPVVFNMKDADENLSKVFKKSKNKYYYENKQFTFTIITDKNDMQMVKVANAIASQLVKNGINAKVDKLESDEMILKLLRRDYDAYVLSWQVDENFNPFPFWSSNKSIGTFNLVSYYNPKVDEVLSMAVSTMDKNDAFSYWEEFQKIVDDDQPYAFLYVPNRIIVVNNVLKSFDGIYESKADVMSNLDIFYVEKTGQKTLDLVKMFEPEKPKVEEKKTTTTNKTTPKEEKKVETKPEPKKKTAAEILSEEAAKTPTVETKTTPADTVKEEVSKPIITIQPVITKLVQPAYPDAAKKLGVEGMVFIQVTVAPDGSVKDASVLKALNPALDAAALDAAKKCTFKAGTVDGVASEMKATIPFRFKP